MSEGDKMRSSSWQHDKRPEKDGSDRKVILRRDARKAGVDRVYRALRRFDA